MTKGKPMGKSHRRVVIGDTELQERKPRSSEEEQGESPVEGANPSGASLITTTDATTETTPTPTVPVEAIADVAQVEERIPCKDEAGVSTTPIGPTPEPYVDPVFKLDEKDIATIGEKLATEVTWTGLVAGDIVIALRKYEEPKKAWEPAVVMGFKFISGKRMIHVKSHDWEGLREIQDVKRALDDSAGGFLKEKGVI